MPSNKVLAEKQAEVAGIVDSMKNSLATVLVDARGLTVEEDSALRVALRKEGVQYKVRKNTLTKRAAAELGIEGLDAYLAGPTAVATSAESFTGAAKVLCEYAKKYKALEIKCGIVDGTVVDAEGVKQLAEMPPREVLIAKVLGGFNAPISGFVNVLNGNIRGLVVALNAIAEKKGA